MSRAGRYLFFSITIYHQLNITVSQYIMIHIRGGHGLHWESPRQRTALLHLPAAAEDFAGIPVAEEGLIAPICSGRGPHRAPLRWRRAPPHLSPAAEGPVAPFHGGGGCAALSWGGGELCRTSLWWWRALVRLPIAVEDFKSKEVVDLIKR